ncbi:MAG: DUF4433 domain-containing protein, partial [Thermotogota bacterium]|nr:DUF4433 domain-containing protein [Thermotogota bacterium]
MKTWSSKIQKHIEYWSSTLSGHKWWPRFIYHYTDINNIPNILSSGKLYSRNKCEELELMKTDNASIDIINQTPQAHKRFVRLYFRPKTPTQYRNEGIRPHQERWNESHCPVPIFLIFDSYGLMTKDDTEFSDGNMAAHNVNFGPNETDFDRIPFDKVFHRGRYNPETNQEIKFHRNAEILIPNELDINENLRYLACRSHAERDTLIYLLSLTGLDIWRNRIRIGDSTIFERRWTYIDSVYVNNNFIKFNFNKNNECRNNFNAEFFVTYPNDKTWIFKKNMGCKSQFTIKFKNYYEFVNIKIELDDSLAYHN